MDVANSSSVDQLKLPVQHSGGVMFGTYARIFHNPGFHFQVGFPKEQVECGVCMQAYRVQTLKVSLQFVANFVTEDCTLISYLQQEHRLKSSKSSCCCVNPK